MNARTKSEFLATSSRGESLDQIDRRKTGRHSRREVARKPAGPDQGDNPVIQHLDNLQEQLSGQLDNLNTVVDAMQRISDIMDRMAKREQRLNRQRADGTKR